MKKCTRCGNEFEIHVFQIVNKKTGKRSSMCPSCNRAYDREYWAKSDSIKRKRKYDNGNKIKDRNRLFIIEHLKNNPCVDCGESDIVVLEFDHLRDKEFNISDARRNSISIGKLKKEIDKCDVVCANCHKRRTAKQFNWYKSNRALV